MDGADLANFRSQLVEFSSGQVTPVDDGGRLPEVGPLLTDQARHGNEIRRRISIGIRDKANHLGFDDSAASVQLSIDDKNMPGERRFAASMKIDKISRNFPTIFAG